MRKQWFGAAVICLAAVACGGSTAEVVIDTTVEDLEGGTFVATGDLFECEGLWSTIEIHMNESDVWWFEDEFVCDDGSGTLTLRTEGEGTEPNPGEFVGTWSVLSGSGDYEGFSGSGSYDLSLTPWSEHREGELTSG